MILNFSSLFLFQFTLSTKWNYKILFTIRIWSKEMYLLLPGDVDIMSPYSKHISSRETMIRKLRATAMLRLETGFQLLLIEVISATVTSLAVLTVTRLNPLIWEEKLRLGPKSGFNVFVFSHTPTPENVCQPASGVMRMTRWEKLILFCAQNVIHQFQLINRVFWISI